MSASKTVDVEIDWVDREPVVMNRRRLIQGLASGSVVALAGCTQNRALGRSQLILVSDGQLAQMAASSWSALKKQERISRDPRMNARLRTVGSRIVQSAGLGNQPWEFTLFDSDEANAFVLPGGKVGFYEGIFKRFDNDHHLAAVMGHEVGHVTARHSAERYSQQLAAGLGMTAAAVAMEAGDVQGGKEIAAVLGMGVQFGVLLPYSRRHELEADTLGLRYMHASGYDARQAVGLWQNMAKQSKGSAPPEFMSTHPSHASRIANIQQELKRMGLAAVTDENGVEYT
ncbi:peptidase M48 Ste24p [Tepidicaulis marinus]|uniref:Peptidase M48 Ste24p n=1 Tax=Tepidicaulis marinus TaxID=1333998 RepID=A0A081BCU2_9HYPH|nr:M48 family metallopeptidase [Tepidicaulis marinus]GAK45860.1 peptidase M48 Ste24p [Tepidicaulis marinus]